MNQTAHAERGVEMALTSAKGELYQWNGENLCILTLSEPDGEKGWHPNEVVEAGWRSGETDLFLSGKTANHVRFLPPLEDSDQDNGGSSTAPLEPPAPIEVGSQWRRNSDGKQCVVRWVGGVGAALTIENDGEVWLSVDNQTLMRDFTHLFTPAQDLSNVPDGAKIVCMETGEVVTAEVDQHGYWWLHDANGEKHSVNGLPANAILPENPSWHRLVWWKRGKWHREEGAAFEYGHGGRTFCLEGKELTPEEWGAQTPLRNTPEKVLEEYRHLLKPDPVVAVVGMGVDVVGAEVNYSGKVEYVSCNWIAVRLGFWTERRHRFINGRWEHASGGKRTITHKGRPVVLPDHIPDVRKLIEEPAAPEYPLSYLEIFQHPDETRFECSNALWAGKLYTMTLTKEVCILNAEPIEISRRMLMGELPCGRTASAHEYFDDATLAVMDYRIAKEGE